MIVPIQIEMDDLAREFSLSQQDVDNMKSNIVQSIAVIFHENWRTQARMNLNSTRNLYMRSLVVGSNGPFISYVALTGVLPNMIEQGAGPWDIKDHFKRSKKVKYAKDGSWYLTIPFRFATPGSIGENEAFSGILPVDVYNAIRKSVGSTRTAPGGNRLKGGGLNKQDIPPPYDQQKTRGAFSDIYTKKFFPAYTHKNSIYEGIIKNKKVYEKADQSQYVSFRRAGEKSDPFSWIHRGFAPYKLAEKALGTTDISGIADRVIDSSLSNLGF